MKYCLSFVITANFLLSAASWTHAQSSNSTSGMSSMAASSRSAVLSVDSSASNASLVLTSENLTSMSSSSTVSSSSDGSISSSNSSVSGSSSSSNATAAPTVKWEPPVLSTDSWGANTLSPICASGGLRLWVNSTATRRIPLASSSVPTTILFLDCFSYLRVPVPATKQCWENATKEILVEIDIVNNETGEKAYTVPLTNIFGGSTSALSFVEPFAFLFELYVKIPDDVEFPQGCVTELQLSYPNRFAAKPTPVVKQRGPRLLHTDPFVFTKNKEVTFSFAINRHPKNKLYPDQFYLATVARGCWDGPGRALGPSDRAMPWANIPSYWRPYANNTIETFARWTTKLTHHGHFFLCVIPAGFYPYEAPPGVNGIEVGYIEVFGGNPAMYTLLGGHTTIRLNTQYTLIFEGTALDLRPGHDQAKVVDAKPVLGRPLPSCEDGPGLGSEVNSNLGPGDDYGQHIKIAHFNFTVTTSGRFFVCYKRYTTEWIRVYPIEYAAPHSRSYLKNLTHLDRYHSDATFAPQRTDYTPTPTRSSDQGFNNAPTFTPQPGAPPATPAPNADSASCTSNGQYKYQQSQEVGEYVTLHFTNKSAIGQAFLETLSNVLCVPLQVGTAKVISWDAPYFDESSQSWSIDIELDCLVGNCAAGERLQYLVWLYGPGRDTAAAKKLVAAGAIGAGAQDFDVVTEPEPAKEKNSILPIVIVFLIIILVVVGVLVCVVVYKKKNKDPVAATNRPAGPGGSAGPAGTHRDFQYGQNGQGPQGGDFDDVVAGIPVDNRPQPREEYQTGVVDQEHDDNNDALPAIEMKDPAPTPVHPEREGDHQA